MNSRDRSSASRTARDGDDRSSPDETDANDATTGARDGADALWRAKNALCVFRKRLLCVFRKRLLPFLFLHFTSSVVRSMYLPRCYFFFSLSLSLSHLAPRTVSLPSFLAGLLSS